MRFNNLNFKSGWIFILLGFLIYINSLGNKFVFDDAHMVLNNVFLRSLKYIPEYFKGYLSSVPGAPKMFRPLLMLSFNLNYLLTKYNPIGYHLFNLGIHIFNSWLLWIILPLLGFNFPRSIYLTTSLIFLSHPINVEAVTYISSRSDLLVTSFVLLWFLNLLQWERSKKRKFAFSGVIFFTLALLFKELAASIPIFLFMYIWIKYGIRYLRRTLKFYLPYPILLLLYLLLRSFLYQGNIGVSSFSKGYWLSILTQAKVAFFYIRLFLFPYPLSIEHQGLKVYSVYEISGIMALVLILIAWMAIIGLRKFMILKIGVCWYLSFLLPKFLTQLNFAAMEHHFYLPSIGIYFLILPALVKLKARAGRFYNYLMVILIFLLSILTFSRNFTWKDTVRIWRDVLNRKPNSIYALEAVADGYKSRGEYQKALRYFKKIFQFNPDGNTATRVLINMAEINRLQGNYQEAWRLIDLVLRLKVEIPQAYLVAGLVWFDQGDFQKAEGFWQKAIALAPNSYEAYYNIGLIYFNRNEFAKAEKYFNKSLSLNLTNAEAYLLLGAISEKESNIMKAIDCYQKAVKYSPSDFKAHYNLGTLYARIGDNRAEKELKKAIEINPQFAQAYYNLALFYLGEGLGERANVLLQKSEDLGYEIPQEIKEQLRELSL